MTTVSEALAWNTKIQNILKEYQVKQAALRARADTGKHPNNPKEWNAAPPRLSQIRSLRQDSSDVHTDTPQTARPIGDLTGGRSRLNIISALTKGERVDFFSFKVTTAGKAGLSVASDKGVHIQLLKKNGEIIADSEVRFGEKAQNYADFTATKLYLEKGEYLIKVTRNTGDTLNEQPNYALQLSMGRYFTEDYETVETPAASATAGLLSVGAQNGFATSTVLNQLAGGNLFDFLV